MCSIEAVTSSVGVCVCVSVCLCADSGFNIDQRTVSAFIGHDIKDFCHVNDIDQLLRHLTEGSFRCTPLTRSLRICCISRCQVLNQSCTFLFCEYITVQLLALLVLYY